MIIHHVATMFLLYFSWIINFPNIGCIVLLLHDAADPALAVSSCGSNSKTVGTYCSQTFGPHLII